jgi:acyl dehydratase
VWNNGEADAVPDGGRLVTPEWFFEDFPVGDTVVTMRRTITEGDLGTFVGLAGFFEETFISANEETLFNRRFVPGCLTLSIAEGLYILTGRMRHGRALLGLTDLRLVAPVACGDTIHARITVELARRIKRPRHGIVTTSHTVVNEDGATVLTYRTTRMLETRGD